MIRVRAAARLHFGLLSLPAAGAEHWPDLAGEPAVPVRHFGGAGLMVEDPALELTAQPAAAWSAEGPLAGRALEFARRAAATWPSGAVGPFRFRVFAAPPEHCGLGTGTQLGLAVARALALAAGRPDLVAADLARRAGRGLRSALGVHGFDHGGFLLEGGKRRPDDLGLLLARADFPDPWRVVLVCPRVPAGLHGDPEAEAFRDLHPGPDESAALCRLALLGLWPALAERDLPAFAEALGDFNARAGAAFARAQGGTYAGARGAEVVAFLRRWGARGAGQSSWGPTLFAVAADEDQARALAGAIRDRFGLSEAEVLVTRARNQGAAVLTGEGK